MSVYRASRCTAGCAYTCMIYLYGTKDTTAQPHINKHSILSLVLHHTSATAVVAASADPIPKTLTPLSSSSDILPSLLMVLSSRWRRRASLSWSAASGVRASRVSLVFAIHSFSGGGFLTASWI